MFRLMLRLTLALLAMWMAASAAPRLSAYNDTHLQALFRLDDCRQPCFLGIRPGLTTVPEAIRLLEAARQHGSLEYTTDDIGLAWNWRWPASAGNGRALLDGRGIVHAIVLYTDVRFGEIWLALRATPRRQWEYVGQVWLVDRRAIVSQGGGVYYHQPGRCLGSRPYYWNTPVNIWMGASPPQPAVLGSDCDG